MIHDFRNGGAAQLLRKLGVDAIEASSIYTMPDLGVVRYDKIVLDQDHYVYRKGEDVYVMFAHLPAYKTAAYGLPVYHVTQCDTRKEYSGFAFASRMPVDIRSTDEVRDYKRQNLRMCKKCRRSLVNALWGGYGDLPWFDYVLKVAAKDSHVRRDGYISIWRQTSEAVREKAAWTCAKCHIKLPLPEKGVFLEVHHLDLNKLNNLESNLQALCVECHANVDDLHRRNYSNGPNRLKLEEFKRLKPAWR